MKQSRWMWRTAQVSFFVSLLLLALPVQAGQGIVIAGVDVPWAIVAGFVAVGAAWGDLKANRTRDRAEFEAFQRDVKDGLKEIRSDVKELTKSRGR